MNFDSKENGAKKTFLAKSSMNIMYPNGEDVFMVLNHETKSWLLEESMFVSFDGWSLSLRIMLEGKAFLAKWKHQYHVSQWEECVQSPKELRLLQESNFVPLDRWTLILGEWWKEKLFSQSKALISCIPAWRSWL